MKNSLTSFSREEIKAIHELSRKYNRLAGKAHAGTLLELMREHVREIKELYGKRDPHFVVETGDLAVLCFELMREVRRSPDGVMAQCYGRYRRKLSQLIKELSDGDKKATVRSCKAGKW